MGSSECQNFMHKERLNANRDSHFCTLEIPVYRINQTSASHSLYYIILLGGFHKLNLNILRVIITLRGEGGLVCLQLTMCSVSVQ